MSRTVHLADAYMSENDAKPFEITGADGNTIEIKHGRYYFNTKSRCERMCLNSLSKECRQVYAAEELLTMGFRTERVRIMTGKDTDGIPQYRDATTADLAGMTGLDPRQVRRALQELDDARLGERRRSDGTNGPLSKGKVTIYSFAEPRSTSAEEAKRRTRASAFSDWPESWEVLKNLARRLKLDISEDFLGALDADARVRLIEEGAEVARVLEKAEKAAARFLKGGRADDALNKEERTDRTSERKSSSSAVPSMQEEPPQQKAEEEDGSSDGTYKTFKTLYPPDHLDDAKAKPAFERLKKPDRIRVIRRLRVYLKCERWIRSPQFIPLASNWIPVCDADPPPYLERAARAGALAPFDEQVAMMKRLNNGGYYGDDGDD